MYAFVLAYVCVPVFMRWGGAACAHQACARALLTELLSFSRAQDAARTWRCYGFRVPCLVPAFLALSRHSYI